MIPDNDTNDPNSALHLHEHNSRRESLCSIFLLSSLWLLIVYRTYSPRTFNANDSG
eukprot:m.372539 g.372539  ORF g.372539 m.372539 type:complete len:56 (+) comp16689_c0_seq2:4581-4748(+)